MRKLKNNNVSLVGLCPQISLAVCLIAHLWGDDEDFVITSANDSNHSRTSLHWDGKAIDIRSKNLTGKRKLEVLRDVRRSLGADFDFILEGTGTPNEHFHLEWQPKG